MNDILKILRLIRQKIPLNIGKVVYFYQQFSSIPRKTYISGHFNLNTNKNTENQLIF